MPRRPSDSAYLLALALRDVWNTFQTYNDSVREYNQKIREFNAQNRFSTIPPIKEQEEKDCIFWRDVIDKLEGMKELSENLSMVKDADYRAVIFDAIKQPYNKVRGSKGFARLVPELETIRRYGPIDINQPMDLTEEEARDFADLVWQQEMQPMIDSGCGVDPIHKQIIAKKVAVELGQFNIKYLGEEIVNVVFDDVELNLYSDDNSAALAILKVGIENAYEIFNYDPNVDIEKNQTFVRQSIVMYNRMLEKEMSDKEIDTLCVSIIQFFEYAQRLIE